MTDLLVGTVKWFGGLNSKTGRVNEFGFIDSSGDDIFVHRTQVISALEGLAPDVSVLFLRGPGRGERPTAQRVRILSEILDDEIGPILEDLRSSPASVLRVLLSRQSLAEWRAEIIATIPSVDDVRDGALLEQLWARLPPSGIDDPLFLLAPWHVKLRTIRGHYRPVRDLISQLASATADAITSTNAATLYANLNDQDKEIARQWARDGRPAVYAKMLSARAAEIAAKEIYERAGHSVADVSIAQLEAGRTDWLTHDLLLDGSLAVDVKNSRRPIAAKDFYVEHTVPTFKLDRRSSDVRIAAFLSPYVKVGLLDHPFDQYFPKEDVVFLGETSALDIGKLSRAFDAPNFSVPRTTERVFPSWIFSYPASWYRDYNTYIETAESLDWPSEEDWDAVFSDLGKATLLSAYCVLQKALPASLSDKMWGWQISLHQRLRSVVGTPPNLPAIFLTILTDFLLALHEQRENYTPEDCEQLLFAGGGPRYPLGAIDPLQLVSNLIKTLRTLWAGRGETRLARFRQFRLVGLGILQGRESQERPWTTIVAYCGGIQYELDEQGRIKFDAGRPTPRGKCGHTPLIIGESQTCPSCRKLVCARCSFCSQPCRERSLNKAASLAEEQNSLRREQHRDDSGSQQSDPPTWDVPLDAYEDDGRWERIR